METILETKVEFGPGRYEMHGFLHTAYNVVEFDRITILKPLSGYEHTNIRVGARRIWDEDGKVHEIKGGEYRFSTADVEKITFNKR